jgi:peptide/nickel transport system ATP-binding protein
MKGNKTVLQIQDLEVKAKTIAGTSELLKIKNMELAGGEILGLVGESGAGKSILALTIMGLLPNNVYVARGKILYKGEDLLKKSKREMEKIRGEKLTMIFQDPMASLNPVFTVKQLLSGVIKAHNPALNKKEIYKKALEMIELVKLSDPEITLQKYPHELSGGMRQRVLISMALSSGADLLISDEATRALDVTIQAGILKLLAELGEKLNLSTIFISSNIALAAAVCRRIGILYSGELIEIGEAKQILQNPSHLYTRSFLASLPSPDKKGKPLPIVKGRIPDPLNKPKGCTFSPRCPNFSQECSTEAPDLKEVSPGHFVACYKGDDIS